MLKMNLQLFAHKKGVGSSKNGRDSESKRLGVKSADGEFVLRSMVLLDSKEWEETRRELLFTQLTLKQ